MEESKILSKYFPIKGKSKSPFYIDNPEEYPDNLLVVLNCFKKVEGEISKVNKAVGKKQKLDQKELEGILKIQKRLKSNQVLAKVRAPLKGKVFSVEEKKENGFSVEGKKGNTFIEITNDRGFRVDAISKDGDIIIEVEGGQTTYARKCFYDIFKACMICCKSQKKVYLVIAVPKYYLHRKGKNGNSEKIVIDNVYDYVYKEIEAIFASGFGESLPLEGILLIGY